MRISRDTARGWLGVALAFLVIAGIHLVKPSISSAPDFACTASSKGSALIDVRSGESGSEIAQELFDKKVTKSYSAFFRVAVADARSASIAPGLHRVEIGICAQDALTQLLDSKRIENLLSITEGTWNSEIKGKLIGLGFASSAIEEAFSSALRPEGFSKLEGLLFPAQYSFDTATSLSTILSKMIDRSVSEMRRAGFFKDGVTFTPYQLLTIASLVQAEGDSKDFAKISQVVRNRLKVGMPLQFDSTVHYIKGSRGSVFLSTQSTLVNSPYNTYKRYGLPPSPINNPGSDAMFAATHPEAGNWIFFITVAPGDTRFTDSIEQFNSWKVLYKKNLRAGAFGDQ